MGFGVASLMIWILLGVWGSLSVLHTYREQSSTQQCGVDQSARLEKPVEEYMVIP